MPTPRSSALRLLRDLAELEFMTPPVVGCPTALVAQPALRCRWRIVQVNTFDPCPAIFRQLCWPFQHGKLIEASTSGCRVVIVDRTLLAEIVMIAAIAVAHQVPASYRSRSLLVLHR